MRFRLFVGLALVSGFLPASGLGAQEEPVVCPTVEAPDIQMDPPTYIDRQRAGGEPVSVVGQDGSISVSAHAGTTHVYKNPSAGPGSNDFLVGYTNQTLHWRSTDGGRTWTYIGIAGQREGPHSATSNGFSDPDLTIDAGGRIYDTEINLANVSVFSSIDDGQSYPFANPVAGHGDRPWLTGQQADEVFLYINSTPLHYLQRSTDGGLTFKMVTTSFPAEGKLLNDPLNPTTGLIGPLDNGVTISNDEGATWEEYGGAKLDSSTQFFGTPIAVDRQGGIYAGSAGGYGSANDTTANGKVSFAYFDRATKEWNPTKISIPIPEGDALWPWIVAGDDGRVALVWYQNLKGKPNEFYIYMAYTHNGHGTTVTCSDGSTQFVPPKFTVVNASVRPIHIGKICLGGTGCNANPDFEGGDRRLGDFFTVNHDLQGNVFIVSGDTRLPNVIGGPKMVGNPIFIRQIGGEKILAQPIAGRKARCLWPIPSC